MARTKVQKSKPVTGALRGKCDPSKVENGIRGGLYYINPRGSKTYIRLKSKCAFEYYSGIGARVNVAHHGKVRKKNIIGDPNKRIMRDRHYNTDTGLIEAVPPPTH